MASLSLSQKPLAFALRKNSVVNLSDVGHRERNAKTNARLNQEYQTQQDKAEKARERHEIERLFRLLDEGYITTSELKKIYKVHPPALGSRKYAIPYEMLKAKKGNDSKEAARQKKSRSVSPKRRAHTAPSLRSETTSHGSSSKSICAYALQYSYSFTTSPCATSRLQCFTERPHTVHSDSSRKRQHNHADDTPTMFQRERPKRHVAPSWLSRYVHPIVVEMQTEESVDRLYDLATDLLHKTHVSSKPTRPPIKV